VLDEEPLVAATVSITTLLSVATLLGACAAPADSRRSGDALSFWAANALSFSLLQEQPSKSSQPSNLKENGNSLKCSDPSRVVRAVRRSPTKARVARI